MIGILEKYKVRNITPIVVNPILGNIIHYWDLESANAIIGGLNGTNFSNAYDAGGVVSKRLNITSSTQGRVEIADNSALSFVSVPFSISIWVKFSVVGTIDYLLSKRGTLGSTDREYAMSFSSGVFSVIVFDQSSGGFLRSQYTLTPSTGVWYNMVLTFDGSTGLKLYFDGTEQTTINNNGSFTACESLGGKLVFGAEPFNTASKLYGLNGYMDEIYFFDKELTASDCQFIYDQGILGNTLNV